MFAPLWRRYHCDFKIAVSLGVASAERTGGIPASTIHRFRNRDYGALVELGYVLEETLSIVRRFAKSKRAKAAMAPVWGLRSLLSRSTGTRSGEESLASPGLPFTTACGFLISGL